MRRGLVVWLALWLAPPMGAAAQAADSAAPAAGPTGREYAGLPAVNYDSDEGFGYGVILELYEYGSGGHAPYVYTLQPTVFLTTGGRRDFTLFFDAPHVLAGGWRLDAYLASEEQITSPFYGTGNDAPYDSTLEADPNPYWYRFGRTRRQLRLNVQRSLDGLGLGAGLRALAGAGVMHVTVDPVPRDSGSTLVERLSRDRAAAGSPIPEGWWNYVRLGLIRDTRDREVGPGSGAWSEVLVQWVAESLGSEASYRRYTATDRRYVTILPGLVFANRLLVQQVTGDAPFYELFTVESSFKAQEGLGGAGTIRGVPKNRYVGRGLFLWNAELRWRAGEWRMMGRPFHVVLSAFLDSGRVWMEERVPVAELLTGLHHGYGGGVRVGMGENFVVAVDGGTSEGHGLAVYIGLGYLY